MNMADCLLNPVEVLAIIDSQKKLVIRLELLRPKVRFLDAFVVQQISAASRDGHLTRLQNISPIRCIQRNLGILLYKQDKPAFKLACLATFWPSPA